MICEDGGNEGRNGLEQYCENCRISKRLTRAKIGKLLTNRFQPNLEFKIDTKVKNPKTHLYLDQIIFKLLQCVPKKIVHA